VNPPVTDSSAQAADKPADGWVAFVGAGPGDEGLLTVRATDLLARADLVVAGPELADRLGQLVRAGAETADTDALAQDPKLLIKAAKAGQHVVRLVSGDPLLFGPAAAEAAACAKARVPFEIVPGVPTATAVPAYAGIPLTSDNSGDVRIIHAALRGMLNHAIDDGVIDRNPALGLGRQLKLVASPETRQESGSSWFVLMW